jgi:uncharacterized Zn-binding protein involved in type VI secretion
MSRWAARVDDWHECPLDTPGKHEGGALLGPAAPKVFINRKHAVRVGDHAFCKTAPPDTVRGGLISVMVHGMPLSGLFHQTDVGFISSGSPNVFIGESKGGPLTPAQAQWLYEYLKSQKDIPFGYSKDGCFARADRMCNDIAALGIPVQKQWVFATDESGQLKTPGGGSPTGTGWDWHVAPVVPVQQPGGGTQPMIFDPSIGSPSTGAFQRPLTVDEWLTRQHVDPAKVDTDTTGIGTYRRGFSTKRGTRRAEFPPKSPDASQEDLDEFRRKAGIAGPFHL